MIDALLRRLAAPAPDPLTDDDARLALTALLVRIARADGDYSAEEKTRIDAIAASRFGLSPFEATALRNSAETLEAGAADTVRFTRAIKESVPHDARLQVMEALWGVALADGSRDAAEDSVVRLAASLLGITDVESARARQRVQSRA